MLRHLASRCMKLSKAYRETVAQLGAGNAFLYAMDRVLSAASGGRIRIVKYYVVAQPVSGDALLPPGRGRKLTVRPVLPGDDLARAFPRPPAVIDSRYRQGAHCLAAYKDGEFVGFHWHVHRQYEEDEVRAIFGMKSPAAVWDFDVHIEPGHRLGIAFLRLWEEANGLLAGQGVHWSCSRISAYNADSLRSHGRLSATRLGMAVFLRIGPWQAMMSNMRPRLHVSLQAASRPVFQIDTTWLDASRPGRNPSLWRNHAASR
ncbi:hypothetical protein [Noviherbaspirillum galbum]|uniref:Uncharacterized protein n=1 Tax=Noviherbaspirillum galbum TaxID=2709383 RepID=A0A6B3SX86_9BURK|nr:hypothetical protein [Noviherbaspirillum galbum]NEX64135.1 hypothetical protein [Noviherbaspirillum galbum]